MTGTRSTLPLARCPGADAQTGGLRPRRQGVYSYACSTGLGIQAELHVAEGEDPLYEKSLAQLMANSPQTTAWAFPRRSNYDQTYGDAGDRAGLASAREKVRTDAQAMTLYRRQLSEYQKRLAVYRLGKQDNSALPPDEKAPLPPRKAATEVDETLVQHADSRDKNDQRSVTHWRSGHLAGIRHRYPDVLAST